MATFLQTLTKIYGESELSQYRFQALKNSFTAHFSADTIDFFSSPGRCEIIGNHTDHNGGKIIAASINMDTIGAAARNQINQIRIVSEGYPTVSLDLAHLSDTPKCDGTRSLLAGICQGFLNFGFQIGGFDACLSSNVIRAAGVSSSASFEMLLCTMINYFFNQQAATVEQCAKIGRYAENEYWDKKCGLLDEMACATGGAIQLDFHDAENPMVSKVNFDFSALGYDLLLINTGKGHADLSREYSEIPTEMYAVAQALGVSTLAEADLSLLLSHLPEVRAITGDRAILRAQHFFHENARVDLALHAMQEQNIKMLLALLNESGDSSWKLLQNCYAISNPQEQSVPLLLTLTQNFLQKIADGCCRVHGGGFAGTILCVVPKEQNKSYRAFISQFVDSKNIYPIQIRPYGAIHIGSAGSDIFN